VKFGVDDHTIGSVSHARPIFLRDERRAGGYDSRPNLVQFAIYDQAGARWCTDEGEIMHSKSTL